jgi:hypothetical protein
VVKGTRWVPLTMAATIGRVVTAQDARTVVRIRREYERLSGAFARSDGLLALPHVALLAEGTAPA